MQKNEVRTLESLSPEDQKNLRAIFSGELLPPLYSDIIAKTIFNPDVHPDRLNFLMRAISKDNTIDVESSAGNEAFRQSVHSKGMISDIPSWLKDRRAANLEFQKVRQDFIFTRIDLYVSDMLLLQYSVDTGKAKGDLNYTDLKEAIIIVLMVESPKPFKEYNRKSQKYIHRFTKMTADTGLSYPPKGKIIYVQLDKCLKQFRRGYNAEAKDHKPDRLQTWLSMIADVNDRQVGKAIECDNILKEMRKELYNMAQDKEVQNMLLQEKYERMDWVSYGNEKMREGEARGVAIGEARGEARGVAIGENKLAELFSKLFALGRSNEAEKAANDAEFRAKLLKEFDII